MLSCRAVGVNPLKVMAMTCVCACPATNPTASSASDEGVRRPELEDVDLAAAPGALSSGDDAATPEYSCKVKATADVVDTVTPLTGRAFAAYHISPSEFWPATANAPTLTLGFTPSLAAVIGFEVPV